MVELAGRKGPEAVASLRGALAEHPRGADLLERHYAAVDPPPGRETVAVIRELGRTDSGAGPAGERAPLSRLADELEAANVVRAARPSPVESPSPGQPEPVKPSVTAESRASAPVPSPKSPAVPPVEKPVQQAKPQAASEAAPPKPAPPVPGADAPGSRPAAPAPAPFSSSKPAPAPGHKTTGAVSDSSSSRSSAPDLSADERARARSLGRALVVAADRPGATSQRYMERQIAKSERDLSPDRAAAVRSAAEKHALSTAASTAMDDGRAAVVKAERFKLSQYQPSPRPSPSSPGRARPKMQPPGTGVPGGSSAEPAPVRPSAHSPSVEAVETPTPDRDTAGQAR